MRRDSRPPLFRPREAPLLPRYRQALVAQAGQRDHQLNAGHEAAGVQRASRVGAVPIALEAQPPPHRAAEHLGASSMAAGLPKDHQGLAAVASTPAVAGPPSQVREDAHAEVAAKQHHQAYGVVAAMGHLVTCPAEKAARGRDAWTCRHVGPRTSGHNDQRHRAAFDHVTESETASSGWIWAPLAWHRGRCGCLPTSFPKRPAPSGLFLVGLCKQNVRASTPSYPPLQDHPPVSATTPRPTRS
mmetsp:Transcript_58599/g.125933  ORF Transcript_58599/g.125933 Transcript_58599/m.125933 type:complete len:243 (+) Transcript_58599:465-1193(+)